MTDRYTMEHNTTSTSGADYQRTAFKHVKKATHPPTEGLDRMIVNVSKDDIDDCSQNKTKEIATYTRSL